MAKTKIHQRLYEMLNIRNILDNGGFEIWQRGVGPFSVSGYTCDRWNLEVGTGATVSVSRESTEIVTGDYSAKINRTVSGTGGTSFYQSVENYKNYRGKTITFSVKVKTSLASTVRLTFSDGVGSGYSSYHTGDGTWQTLSLVCNVSSSASQLNLSITLGIGTTGVVYVDNAMLVYGDEPVDFVPTLPAEDLVRCQRWYTMQESFYYNGYGFIANVISQPVRFPVEMANIPTVVITAFGSWTTVNTTNFTYQRISKQGFFLCPGVTATGSIYGWIDAIAWTAVAG